MGPVTPRTPAAASSPSTTAADLEAAIARIGEALGWATRDPRAVAAGAVTLIGAADALVEAVRDLRDAFHAGTDLEVHVRRLRAVEHTYRRVVEPVIGPSQVGGDAGWRGRLTAEEGHDPTGGGDMVGDAPIGRT